MTLTALRKSFVDHASVAIPLVIFLRLHWKWKITEINHHRHCLVPRFTPSRGLAFRMLTLATGWHRAAALLHWRVTLSLGRSHCVQPVLEEMAVTPPFLEWTGWTHFSWNPSSCGMCLFPALIYTSMKSQIFIFICIFIIQSFLILRVCSDRASCRPWRFLQLTPVPGERTLSISIPLLSHTTRFSRFPWCILCPSPRISHFSEDRWFSLVENGVRCMYLPGYYIF